MSPELEFGRMLSVPVPVAFQPGSVVASWFPAANAKTLSYLPPVVSSVVSVSPDENKGTTFIPTRGGCVLLMGGMPTLIAHSIDAPLLSDSSHCFDLFKFTC